ncbi:MAG: sigma-54 dependent transcriptional regulator [Thermodesulfobacteriota bacterium]|nr:sigma-54 dependent transcriptional regulator [Thermodesulfobacteriota bacterium]
MIRIPEHGVIYYLKSAMDKCSSKDTPSSDPLMNFIGNSPAMVKLKRLIEKVVDSGTTVLILGESGTGKELAARMLHLKSPRIEKPFVPVNCGAIPENLLESELFGHKKGAFTGAITARRGRFEIADGGTLFLDEIGDMSLNMQVKLLRVLQERTFERVGGTKSIKVDVRIIAATHHNLEEAIEKGTFREDLFYRLNVFPIVIPPLRERTEDIEILIEEFSSRLKHMYKERIDFSAEAILSLARYPWPGNLRELSNLVERMTALFPGKKIGYEDMPGRYRMPGVIRQQPEAFYQFSGSGPFPVSLNTFKNSSLPPGGIDLKKYLFEIEKMLIGQALDGSAWIVAHAAQQLGLQRTTLGEKMKKYGFSKSEVRRSETVL